MSSYGSRGPPDIDGMVSLKVDNLTYRTTPEDLRRAFQEYGDVGDVYIPRDRFSRESRGFAFVRFFKKKDAEHAMDSLDGKFIDGRQVRCQMARYGRPSEPHSNRRERGPPRRGYDRYGGSSRRRSRSRSRSPRRRSSRRSRSYSSHSHSPSRSRSRSRGRQASRSRSRSYEQNGAEASD